MGKGGGAKGGTVEGGGGACEREKEKEKEVVGRRRWYALQRVRHY